MAKGLSDIKNTKNIDMFIEVLDARAIKTSSNHNLIATKKPVLRIALKADLADISGYKDSDLLIGSTKDKTFKNKIMSKLYHLMTPKISEAKHQGLLKPTFHVMVVGLPNVGKSSLINFLSSSKNLITSNLPGVTKTKKLQKVDDCFYLYDTPGILAKDIQEIDDGYKLSLIGVIKKEILPLDEVTKFAFDFYNRNYREKFLNHYGINTNNYLEFLENIAAKYQFITKQKRIDLHRMHNFLYDEIINGKICLVNYDQ
jgi:ribosome biogenesis GTPase A